MSANAQMIIINCKGEKAQRKNGVIKSIDLFSGNEIDELETGYLIEDIGILENHL